MNHSQPVKHSGQVFTPQFIVEDMLTLCGYSSPNAILKKHVMENSCGEGAFLCPIVKRYCQAYMESHSDKEELARELQTYIHGIEIDPFARDHCLCNLNEIVNVYGIQNLHWDIIQADALTITHYHHRMDYVIGNPPYVRVHNLAENYEAVKTFHFATGGMTDLYLVFFELGFRMLNDTGKLCYITPSSWLNSLAASNMRNYIEKKQTLSAVVDLGHYQAFERATTYTMISLFEQTRDSADIAYYTYDEANKQMAFTDTLSYNDIAIGTDFYLSKKDELLTIKDIRLTHYPKHCVVKNGFATLADKVFIGNIPFTEFTIPVLKASTGKWHTAFFPYNHEGKPLLKDEIFKNDSIASYLNERKSELLKGKNESQYPDWYLYGRTQALKDVYEEKIAINTLIKDINSIKLNRVPIGSGLYSGLYILTYVPFSIVETILKSENFISYIKTLKNYKSGGYYTFNSKDLEQYLNFKLAKYEDKRNFIPTVERRIHQSNLQFI
jgi:adenine-specific DNA-methyltransferase